MKSKVIVTIPAYNVSNLVENVVVRTLNQDIAEIILVDDCSKDNTYEILKNLQKKYSKVKVLHHEKNRGYGGAQKTLYENALKDNADIIVILHSDGQHLPEELPRLVESLKKKECDVVVGSRALGDMLKGGMPLYKYLGNKTLTFFENIAFGTKLTCFHDGFKAFTKESLNNINYKGLTEDFHYDSEFLIEASINKLRIKEVPITTVYNESFSSVNVIKYTLDIIKLMVFYQGKRIKRFFK